MRQARERLNRLRDDAAELAAARERREALLSAPERHAAAPWEPLYAGRFRHRTRDWAALKDQPHATQAPRYPDARLRRPQTIRDHRAQPRASGAAPVLRG